MSGFCIVFLKKELEMADNYNLNKKYFSLIIPFHNDCKCIKRCVESIISQKMIDFEAIFINLGSTDGTDKIIAKYAKSNPNIEVVNNQFITNINQAYNFGISLSGGKYIKFMSAKLVLDTKALLVLSKMMDNENTDIAFHLKSELFDGDNGIIPQCYDWVKKFVSPVYIFSVFDKIMSIHDLQYLIAFNKKVFVKNSLFFDDTYNRLDISKLIKMFCASKKVSLVYYDMVREIFADASIVSDLTADVANIDNIKNNISKYVDECYFEGAFKKQIDAFYVNQLSNISRYADKNTAKQIANRAKANFKLAKFDYKSIKEICNYKNILVPNSCVKLSIVYTFSKVSETLIGYINNFLKTGNLYEELILVCTNPKGSDIGQLCQNCSQIKYVQSKDIYQVLKDYVRGEHLIFQNDEDISIEDLFEVLSYSFKTGADMTFVPIKNHEYDNDPIYKGYLKYEQNLFDYNNIYANKLTSLLYQDAEIIYKTEYIVNLFKKSNFLNLDYLSLLAVLNSKNITLYSQYMSAYKRKVNFKHEEISKIFYHFTSVNFDQLAEYEKILYKMEVPDIKEFYKKIYYLDSFHGSNKLDKLKVSINSKEQYQINRMNVLNSGLWDERYYLKQFNYAKSKISVDPVDHYLMEGWKNGYSPSKYFDGAAYTKQYPIITENPLVFYLNRGRFQYKTYPVNPYEISEEDIENYWQNKGKNKKVIYMCITGNYDNLEEIKAHTCINSDWDYVCFTDNKDYIKKGKFGIWQIRPLKYTKLDNTRNNRWHKVHPHILFPEYEESIYMDSNINVLTPFLFDEIKERNVDLLLPKHAGNFSIYYEYVWAMKAAVDKLDVLMKECEEIFKQGFPFYYGMPECNIIYRRHSSKLVTDLMDDWWYWIKTYAKRDQLSFSYLLWKYHVKISDCTFVNARIAYKDFCVFLHPIDRK